MKPLSPIRVDVSSGLLALLLFLLSAASAPAFAAVANPDAAAAQEPTGFGPLDPTPPAGMTPEQVIEKFGARESEFKKARENYTFRQTVKVDTISEDTNRVDGEYQQVTDITFNNDGKREEHVVFAPQNTLERVLMTPADFDEIEHRLPFILTTEDLPKYDVVYLGRQHVDELDTYVFSAGPRVLEKGKHYFQGKVWVDQQDFQIVLINGKTVPQDTRRGHEDTPAPIHHLLRAGRRQILVPHLHQGRGQPSLRRSERRALTGRPHAQRSQILRLQAVPRYLAHHLQRPGHHQQQSARRQRQQQAPTSQATAVIRTSDNAGSP